jgi:thioredoxin 1
LTKQVRTFTSAGWQGEVLEAAGVVLVDFWAEWCPPCRKLGPTIEALAAELDGRVVVGKLNVDDHPDIASRYGIMSIPSLLVFKDGRVVEQRVGALPLGTLRDMLASHEEALALP